MSALVSSPSVVWLVPVRNEDVVVHLVPRDNGPDFSFVKDSKAPCGAEGKVDRFGRRNWTRVRVGGRKHCMTCFARACAKPTRVDWG